MASDKLSKDLANKEQIVGANKMLILQRKLRFYAPDARIDCEGGSFDIWLGEECVACLDNFSEFECFILGLELADKIRKGK